jgi:hypothetical protein
MVRDHCRNLEVVPHHAMSRRAWGGAQALIPDFQSQGISHRPGTLGLFQLKGFGSASCLKGAGLFAVAWQLVHIAQVQIFPISVKS